jgi:lipid-A-disaccharide synthase
VKLRIGIIAAETSGDLLGSGLMAGLRARVPGIEFEGIGGPRMLAQGMRSWEPMESLSVMGLVEVLRHLPRLLRLRAELRRRWLASPPALFIGVDAPDFNLSLERRLRQAGVPTVHYVSPTVWAWREKRVDKIRAAVDLLLSIFPFEQDFLARHQVRCEYVGHTLAADMPMHPDREAARARLGLAGEQPVLAVLPGSRGSEVSRLARPFLQAAVACREKLPGLQVLVPLVNDKTRQLWQAQHAAHAPDLPVQEVMGDSRSVLAAADVVLAASGTATFEALLSKRPMVVGYKLNALTYWLARVLRLVKLEHVAMANLLAGEGLAPEFIQGECEPDRLAPALLAFFDDPARVQAIQARYAEVHRELATDTNRLAAEAVMRLLRERGLLQP